jgi:hypothetical protein
MNLCHCTVQCTFKGKHLYRQHKSEPASFNQVTTTVHKKVAPASPLSIRALGVSTVHAAAITD